MQLDGDASGTLNSLPKPSIDTGMGLDRTTAVLQGVLSNYETDLFTPLIEHADALVSMAGNRDYKQRISPQKYQASLRIIADHGRATTFLISDGVMPANEGRGYVLRKIMRRAISHGRLLGQNKPFFYDMVHGVTDLMKSAYPELEQDAARVANIVVTEETRFAHTLDLGLKRFEEERREFSARSSVTAPNWQPEPPFPGDTAFKLYDTFGLPLDFMMDLWRDAGTSLDVEGFEHAMQEQRERARASWKGGAGKATASPIYRDLNKTIFEGYRQTESKNCEVLAIVKNGQGVQALNPGEEGEVVLDHTPFYADSGGQVGDIGVFYDQGHTSIVAEVNGCTMPVQGVRVHKVKTRQPTHVGMKVDAVVHADVREATRRNHTATHLLHAGLRETLGKHVKQAGSLVDPGHLRFDFSHFTGVADEELQDIEDLINKEVLQNIRVETIEDVPIDVAINEYHAMALFGEKYGERVRVVKIGDFSTELCGGTHTGTTGEIGLIKILHEGSVSSGVRRVEPVTGEGSLHHFRKDHQLEHVVATLAPQSQKSGSPAEALRSEWEKKEAEIRKLQRDLEQLRMKSAASSVSSAEERLREINGVKVLAQHRENLDRGQMRTLVDNLRNKLGSGVVVLGSAQDGKVSLIVGVTKDLTSRVPAGKVIKPVAEKVGGSGGGRPDMAEAGGKDPDQLDAALNEAYAAVESLLKT